MYRKIAVGGFAAGLAFTGAGLAFAAGGHQSPQAGGETPHVSARRTAEGVYACDGGRQKAVYNRIVNQYTTFGEGADFAVPGATVKVAGPEHGKNTLSITFSAESQLRNGTDVDYYDWMELEVLVDGVPVQPFGPADSPMALTGSREYSMSSAQFCTEVGPGKHKVSVRTRLVDNGTDDSLTGWLDDYTLRVEKSK